VRRSTDPWDVAKSVGERRDVLLYCHEPAAFGVSRERVRAKRSVTALGERQAPGRLHGVVAQAHRAAGRGAARLDEPRERLFEL
jgi:hypothetical protein